MDKISLKELPLKVKRIILNKLGLDFDKSFFVIDENGEKVIDEYVNRPVKVDNMMIMPGSTVVLDDNPVSLTGYVEDYGDRL